MGSSVVMQMFKPLLASRLSDDFGAPPVLRALHDLLAAAHGDFERCQGCRGDWDRLSATDVNGNENGFRRARPTRDVGYQISQGSSTQTGLATRWSRGSEQKGSTGAPWTGRPVVGSSYRCSGPSADPRLTRRRLSDEFGAPLVLQRQRDSCERTTDDRCHARPGPDR